MVERAKKMAEERVFIQAGGIKIEGLLNNAPGEKAVIVSHPHPLYGGDMNNLYIVKNKKNLKKMAKERIYSLKDFNEEFKKGVNNEKIPNKGN